MKVNIGTSTRSKAWYTISQLQGALKCTKGRESAHVAGCTENIKVCTPYIQGYKKCTKCPPKSAQRVFKIAHKRTPNSAQSVQEKCSVCISMSTIVHIRSLLSIAKLLCTLVCPAMPGVLAVHHGSTQYCMPSANSGTIIFPIMPIIFRKMVAIIGN